MEKLNAGSDYCDIINHWWDAAKAGETGGYQGTKEMLNYCYALCH